MLEILTVIFCRPCAINKKKLLKVLNTDFVRIFHCLFDRSGYEWISSYIEIHFIQLNYFILTQLQQLIKIYVYKNVISLFFFDQNKGRERHNTYF